MDINYKLIVNERLGDAPFVGALISACDCKFGCAGCFNQHIKNYQTITKSPADIISEIKNDPFNEGIIFAGLEWTLQIDEAIELADLARKEGLKTMLYSGHSDLDDSIKTHFDYCKLGQYKNILEPHKEYGVTLASSNQHIYKKGKDYK